jgi:colanic acid/amylovoran biosynthesis protein
MGKEMIVEIKGVGSHNKGAEMMLLTILQELSDSEKDIKFTVAPQPGSCEYSFYSKLKLFPKASFRYKGFEFRYLGKYIPKRLRDMYGLITDDEVDVVLDASGFAYSSQWGEYPSKAMAHYTKKWKKTGKKIILMPQAFGPFKSRHIVSYMKTIIENAELIFARDNFSLRALLRIVNNPEKIKLSPDFTILLKGLEPEYFDPKVHQVCIVSNKRMIDKTQSANRYLKILTKAIAYVQKNCLKPFFLIFGGDEDLNLANEINMMLASQIPIIDEDNPLYIKGIIQNSLGLIGSRFHSLANALYCGTLAVGIGWSHKYEYLFREMDFPEGLLRLDVADEDIYRKLDIFLDQEKREMQSAQLAKRAEEQSKKTKEMFKEVKKTIGLCQ